jgi:hypothetical protein
MVMETVPGVLFEIGHLIELQTHLREIDVNTKMDSCGLLTALNSIRGFPQSQGWQWLAALT